MKLIYQTYINSPWDGDVDGDGWDDGGPEEGGEEHLVAEHQHYGRQEATLQRREEHLS